MYLLRRTALRALSIPSTSFIAKPRSIATYTPASFKQRQQQWIVSSFQRRFASDEATKTEEQVANAVSESTQAESSSIPASADAEEQSTIAPAISSAAETVEKRAADTFDTATQTTEAADGAANSTFAFERHSKTFDSANAPNTTLYIGNLFFEVTDDQLKKVFSRFGAVTKSSIVYDNRGLSRGFGYVTFENQEDATAAVENLNQQVFEGRRMNVQYHKPRTLVRTPRAPNQSNQPSKTLFIGNMSFEMSDKDLNDLFRDIRNVLDVRVAIDRRTGQPRGFAHADFIDITSAERAKGVLEQKEIYGRKLRVDFSGHSSATRNASEQA
ncbi:uncharacterized protein K441DRAFT_661329 [Cenococcum geophilum 1.58]|uniref:uncharacterized protein n=1 Tax=Cenococcum geophilum 1.58 TaxID=794803 RepID=UPI0035900538|nr:hypothetical protein K441DRAFT_661329 [Cenococcum geophilum 1.58]